MIIEDMESRGLKFEVSWNSPCFGTAGAEQAPGAGAEWLESDCPVIIGRVD